MKHLTILIIIFLAFAKVSIADDGDAIAGARVKTPKKTTEQKAISITDALKDAVSLTDEQYSKVYQVNLSYVTQKEQLKASKTENTELVYENMKEILIARKKEIAKILSAEQKETWKAWKEKKREERKANGIKEEPMFDDITDM